MSFTEHLEKLRKKLDQEKSEKEYYHKKAKRWIRRYKEVVTRVIVPNLDNIQTGHILAMEAVADLIDLRSDSDAQNDEEESDSEVNPFGPEEDEEEDYYPPEEETEPEKQIEFNFYRSRGPPKMKPFQDI